MKKENKKIWVYAEAADGKLTKVFTELLCKSRSLGAAEVDAVVLGSGLNNVLKEIKTAGPDKVYYVDDPALAKYDIEVYKHALIELIKSYSPDAVLFGATVTGSELAPSTAAALKIGLAAHCVDITAREDGETSYWVPAFGGNVIGEIMIPNHSPEMASVKPGILAVEEYFVNSEPEMIATTADGLSNIKSGIILKGTEAKVQSGKSLAGADIVISAGRGISSEDTWNKLNEIAVKLGAAVGYTRSLLDRGFVSDESSMIGTSGKSVTPKVYLGFGVSGATHHVCGMNKSKTIINVNKDSNAKIFGISDYKVTAKAEDIIAALYEQLC